MAYTSHGHQIPGTPREHERPKRVSRCGGPLLCPNCANEAALYTHPSNTTLHGKKNDMKTESYARKTFYVDAVRVTNENMEEVANWCAGEIRRTLGSEKRPPRPYIKVDVGRALNERQTRAYEGDWVLFYDGNGFKVYTEQAFEKSFEPVKVEPPHRMFVDPVNN